MGNRGFDFAFEVLKFSLLLSSLTSWSSMGFPKHTLVSASWWSSGSGGGTTLGLFVATPWTLSPGVEPVLVLFLFHLLYTWNFFFFLLGGGREVVIEVVVVVAADAAGGQGSRSCFCLSCWSSCSSSYVMPRASIKYEIMMTCQHSWMHRRPHKVLRCHQTKVIRATGSFIERAPHSNMASRTSGGTGFTACLPGPQPAAHISFSRACKQVTS